MQPSSSSSQPRNYLHRRSPGADPGPPPSVRPNSPGAGSVQMRSSTASNRSAQNGITRRSTREGSGGSASGSASMPLSQIEKSVTHLLVATKELLETLTQWSRGQASDTRVSDVYVRLGYEFNMACRAFTAINVDTSDLGNVPDSLRSILEATLSQEANAESLEKYLPRIRDIIINLLHGLKRKQQRLRQRQGRERDAGLPERTTSVSTTASGASGLTNLIDEGLENGYRPDSRRGETSQRTHLSTSPTPRYTRSDATRDEPRTSKSSEQPSATQNAPPFLSYPSDDSSMPASSSSGDLNIDAFPPPPPPPPPDKQSSALAALQKGGDLERRASRRYSQYQISKHLGGAANGMPILPSQHTPIPNRGRKEARESLRAVQSRESVRYSRTLSSQPKSVTVDSSPSRKPGLAEDISSGQPTLRGPVKLSDSPVVQSLDEKYAPGATPKGPVQEPMAFLVDGTRQEPGQAKAPSKADEPPMPSRPNEAKAGESFFHDIPSPTPPSKDLTLFLQYKSKVKKIFLAEGRDELSIGRLQLAFIEKFSWNTQHNGTDLPEIYIQDPVSGVRHELEDLADVKDGTVLVLNVEPLDEVKRHFDDGLSALTKIVQSVQQDVHDQGTTLQRLSDRHQDTATELARLAAIQPAAHATDGGVGKLFPGANRRLNAGQSGEIQSLRRDLAVLRQTYSNFQSDVQDSMSAIRQKAATVKAVAAEAAVPDIDGDAGYSYVTNGRKKLNSDSDRLVGKVDDLQDLIEDLRKDVVHRGVRPIPRQLEEVAKDITKLTKELGKMEEYMATEKPIWTRIWEKELEDVCQGRDELRLMEDLLVDLRDDLDKASETFTLVEQATKEQMKDSGTGASATTARQFSRGLSNLGNSLNQSAAKEDLLGEVRALQPNHEDRLEAIERAEKLRQKELQGRQGNEMMREIAAVVQEGRLKKAGGVEEVERARKAKDERIRREVWERQNGIIPAEERPGGEDDDDEVEGEVPGEGEVFHDAATLSAGGAERVAEGEKVEEEETGGGEGGAF